MWIHLLSDGKLVALVHEWLVSWMWCEIKFLCSLFHLWYIPTMCIHLFSTGKLFSLVYAWLAFQHGRMICGFKWSALSSTCDTSWPCAFIISQRVSYFSLMHKLCIVSIPAQENDLWDKVVSLLSTCGTSWPCAFIYSQLVSYFSLVHTCLAFQLRRTICGIKVVCSLYHLWYILTMCIHLFSASKLLFTGSCMFSIPT